jgi:hypothetical protein
MALNSQPQQDKKMQNESKLAQIDKKSAFAFGLLASGCFLILSMLLTDSLGLNFASTPLYYAFAVAPFSLSVGVVVGIILLALVFAVLWALFGVIAFKARLKDVEQGVGYGMLFGLALWVLFGLILSQLIQARVFASTKIFNPGSAGIIEISQLVGFFVYGLVAGFLTAFTSRVRGLKNEN